MKAFHENKFGKMNIEANNKFKSRMGTELKEQKKRLKLFCES